MRGVVLATAALVLSAGAARADLDGYVQVDKGRYLAIAGDCAACHASEKGALAGGRAIETPFGNINAANLTPDRDTGLGRWSAEDFWHALHEGPQRGGRASVSGVPLQLLHAGDPRRQRRAVRVPPQRPSQWTTPWTATRCRGRSACGPTMVGWNMLEFTSGGFEPDPMRSAPFNRGAYLVEGLGHCGACHTPMNVIGGPEDSEHLQGNTIQHWFAPNLTNDAQSGLGSWSVDDIVQYLHAGRNLHAAASGPMGEVVAVSTSKMTEPDLRAIATYLKERGAAGPAVPAPLPAGGAQMAAGEAVYADNCSACHARNGMGVADLFSRTGGCCVRAAGRPGDDDPRDRDRHASGGDGGRPDRPGHAVLRLAPCRMGRWRTW